MNESKEAPRFECGECEFFGNKCKCIDHSKFHFARSCFSCDVYTAHHMICSAFKPNKAYKGVLKEWEDFGSFDEWHNLFIDQWHNGKKPKTVGIIRVKPTKDGREVFDDVWDVSYDDFINCRIIIDGVIHYKGYRHIEIKRSSPTGYVWVYDGEGILTV